jgi:CTP:molybdopterin cytidylyltransferase MocA
MAADVVGLVLAAGQGRRFGGPKALVAEPAGRTWLGRAVAALRDAGVHAVYVVVGAEADLVRAAAPSGCRVVEAVDWAEGMGASLRAGLAVVSADAEAAEPGSVAARVAAVVVMLVDTPGVGPAVVRRLTALAAADGLVRASYDGQPGHPVVIGSAHWAGVSASAGGDRGARDYLQAHHASLVECGDIASGADVDTPELLDEWRARQTPG